jgi:glycosyltransferase involved in cell wall biosynthesis
VIIPTFNGGKGLAPTIASLRRQTLRPFAASRRAGARHAA